MDEDRPYYSDFHDAWFFYDEIGDSKGPFSSYKKAMKAYERYCRYLNNSSTWWDRVFYGV